jgi:hypothetical protein
VHFEKMSFRKKMWFKQGQMGAFFKGCLQTSKCQEAECLFSATQLAIKCDWAVVHSEKMSFQKKGLQTKGNEGVFKGCRGTCKCQEPECVQMAV